MKKMLLLASMVAAAAIILWLGRRHPCPKPPVVMIRAIANEVTFAGGFSKGPVINHAGSELAFVRSVDGGRALFFMNVKTGAMRKFPGQHEAFQACAFSPDDRYLLYTDFLKPARDRLLLLDRAANKAVPLALGTFANVFWNHTNRFFCTDEKGSNAQFITLSGTNAIRNAVAMEVAPYGAIPADPEEIYSMTDSGLDVFNVGTGRIHSLLLNTNEGGPHWDSEMPLQWLTCSPSNTAFMFCSWDQSNWRRLYQLKKNDTGWAPVCVSRESEHTYNGQWIQQGGGFAYIANRTNHFFLAIQAANSNDSTNLFLNGHVAAYTVAANGDFIYAIASEGDEPQGIWEYSISGHLLRYVGGRIPLSQAKTLPREEHWLESFDGTKIPYFECDPPHVQSETKYPLVLALPLREMQSFRTWDESTEFLANLGVFHVAVNHRGVDGYGKAFKYLSVEDADQDVEAVYQEVTRNNPNIDKKRVFLMAHSGAAPLLNRIVAKYPGQWAGVIIFSGDPPSREVIKAQNLKVFLFVGDLDLDSVKKPAFHLERWAAAYHMPVHVMHAPHTHHVVTRMEADRQALLEMADFIFDK